MDDAAAKTKAMQSTVHENMLKLLNEEPAEEIGYESEERDEVQHRLNKNHHSLITTN